MASFGEFIKYPTALGRFIVIMINNIYCIPTYIVWMIMLTPLKCINSNIYYKIEGLFFHWLLGVVAMWSYSAGYQIAEAGDDISECRNKRTLVVANHQSTADVPLLMACFNVKGEVLPNIMWIMDRIFKYTNFGIVSMIHGDFFISSGKQNREASIESLRDHIKCSYVKTGKKWIVLFPEGGFLRKRKEVSKNFAIKNNLPILNNVTIPRVGAFETVIKALNVTNCNSNHSSKMSMNSFSSAKSSNSLMLEYILDITIAYPDKIPLTLSSIVHRLRGPCTTHMFYRLYEASSVPQDQDALKQWLYDRFIEKNDLLENFYKSGSFLPGENINSHLIQQDVLRFVLINIFFIVSSYFHVKLFYKLYGQGVYYINRLIS